MYEGVLYCAWILTFHRCFSNDPITCRDLHSPICCLKYCTLHNPALVRMVMVLNKDLVGENRIILYCALTSK